MLETPHVVVGAAIATAIPNPLISIPLAFGSHFVLEKIPHWNPHLNTELKKHGKVTNQSLNIVIADSSAALTLGLIIASQALPNTTHFIVILLACFAAVLPDIIEAPYYFLKLKSDFIEKRWIPFKKSLQNDTNIIPGLATQVITVVVVLILTLR